MPLIIFSPYEAIIAPVGPVGDPTYYDAIIADGPIVYYRMNETGTTEPVDQIGTLTQNPFYSGTVSKGASSLLNGDNDTAVDFAGTGTIRQTTGDMPLGTGAEFINGSFSIEFWIKMNALGVAARIFAQRSTGNFSTLVVTLLADGGLATDKYLPSNLNFVTAPALTAGVSHHVVYTEDGTNRSFYVDGVLFATDANRETYTVSELMTGWAFGGEPYTAGVIPNAVMDEFAIYRHELSPAQILNHYELGNPPSAYTLAVIAADPIVYYRMNETGTTEPVDQIGTLTLDPTYGGTVIRGATSLISGDTDPAIDFAGTGYIRQVPGGGGELPLGDFQQFVNGSFSIEFWILIDSFPGSGTHHIIYEQRNESGSHKNISLAILNTGIIQQDKYLPSNQSSLSNTPLTGGVKHHIVYTEDGVNNRMYIDGVLDATDTSREFFSGATMTRWAIGTAVVTPGNTLDGTMDEFAIYRHELSPAVILNHYTLGVSPPPLTYSEQVILDDPIVYYRMNETGTTEPVDQIGTLTQNPIYTGTVVKETVGLIDDTDTAVDFAGTGYIRQTTGDLPLGVLNSQVPVFSIECWIKLNPSGMGTNRLVFDQRDASGGGSNGSLQIRPTNTVRFDKYLPAAGSIESLTYVLEADTVYHIVYVESSPTREIYINGVLVISDSSIETNSSTMTQWGIGARESDGTQLFDGVIDEVAVYRNKLSAAQILNHYELGIPVVDQNITWGSLVNATDDGGGTITSTGTNNWDSNGFSDQSFIGNGYVEFTAIQLARFRMLGLNNVNSGATLDPDYAIYPSATSSKLYVWENGNTGTEVGTWASGDVLRVEVNGTDIIYKQNGNTVHTTSGHTLSPTNPTYADAALYANGTKIENAILVQL